MLIKVESEKLNEYQCFIDPYDELFDKLFSFKEVDTGKVVVSTKHNAQELEACIIQAASINFSIIKRFVSFKYYRVKKDL